MPSLFLVYFVNLYMFRAYPGPSSEGTTVCIQQLVLIILFRLLSLVLVGLECSVYIICLYSITFISSSLMVSYFAVCGLPFLAGFYFKDFILEMFSVRYLNIFGFFFNYLCLRV